MMAVTMMNFTYSICFPYDEQEYTLTNVNPVAIKTWEKQNAETVMVAEEYKLVLYWARALACVWCVCM